MTLGERIKSLRKGKFSQEKLADLLDVHVNTLIKWEHGKGYPTVDKLKKLADMLGTTTDYLMNDDAELSAVSENQDSGASDKYESENLEVLPYTKEEQKKLNTGMLVYTFKNGEKVEMPPTKESYDIFSRLILNASRVAVL